jgi:hypothetical protein
VHSAIPTSSSKQFPDIMWGMLVENCPNLQQLTLDFFPRLNTLYDITRLNQGLWPQLNSLKIGNAIIKDSSPLSIDSPFMVFLSQHLALKKLVFNQHDSSSLYEHLRLRPAALPHLETFCGISSHIGGIPVPSVITNFQHSDLLNPKSLASACPESIRPFLTSLTFSLHHDSLKTTGEIRFGLSYLLENLPNLLHLDITCLTSDSSLNCTIFNEASGQLLIDILHCSGLLPSSSRKSSQRQHAE